MSESFDESFWTDFRAMERAADERQARLRAEHQRCLADPCMAIPEVGDIVLLNAGLVGRGHVWDRVEATVKKLASTSYYVEIHKDICGKADIRWIPSELVLEVLPASPTPIPAEE